MRRIKLYEEFLGFWKKKDDEQIKEYLNYIKSRGNIHVAYDHINYTTSIAGHKIETHLDSNNGVAVYKIIIDDVEMDVSDSISKKFYNILKEKSSNRDINDSGLPSWLDHDETNESLYAKDAKDDIYISIDGQEPISFQEFYVENTGKDVEPLPEE